MKEIPLTQGKVAIVDDGDFKYLNQWKWWLDGRPTRRTDYARRKIKTPEDKWKKVSMHRAILNVAEGVPVDHINGNGLDNRRENLRVCTLTQNMQNAPLRKDSTSGYKGVHWFERRGKWVAYINFQGKRVHLGYHDKKEDAAGAYNEAAKKYHGEFARLNP